MVLQPRGRPRSPAGHRKATISTGTASPEVAFGEMQKDLEDTVVISVGYSLAGR